MNIHIHAHLHDNSHPDGSDLRFHDFGKEYENHLSVQTLKKPEIRLSPAKNQNIDDPQTHERIICRD
jgi:hypothetical protein